MCRSTSQRPAQHGCSWQHRFQYVDVLLEAVHAALWSRSRNTHGARVALMSRTLSCTVNRAAPSPLTAKAAALQDKTTSLLNTILQPRAGANTAAHAALCAAAAQHSSWQHLATSCYY
jgi:hypothetical protein